MNNVDTFSGQEEEIENFDLILITNSGNRIRESYALYVKQAVGPLGIDVHIHAIPFGQFQNDLLHASTGQPYDLAIIGFAGGGPIPNMMWKFHSTQTSFGQSIYQLQNSTWQAFMEADIGVSTEQVDNLLEAIDFELNPLLRREKLNEFSELYMDKLLYDLPLTTVTTRVAMWEGFGGENNVLWNENELAWGSSWLGAYWETNPQARIDNNADAGTLQFRITDPAKPGNFDPYQSFDTSTTAQTTYSAMNLLNLDSKLAPRPGVAYQWFVEDVVYDADINPATPDELVESGKHTFIIDSTSWQFPATTDYMGNVIPAEFVDANDFALVYEMFKNPITSLNGKWKFDPVVKWEVSTTVTPDDTLKIYLENGGVTTDDYVTFGALTPLPEHILGGTLDVDDPNIAGLQPNGTQIELGVTDFTAFPFNPQQTVQWQHWSSAAGNTLVGPMAIDEFELAPGGGFFTFAARADFPFPNEWDSQLMFAGNSAELNSLYSMVNTTSWNNANFATGDPTTSPVSSLEYFAPHTGGVVDAHYFAFNDQGAMEKPTAQLIDKIIVKNIPDTNAALIAFESGALDTFGSSSLGIDTVQSHQNNPDFVVRQIVPISGPQLLIFNLLNEHLQKRNVRYAIASVIDKNEMIEINDGLATPVHSPVWLVYEKFAPLEFIGAGPGGTDLTWYNPFPIEYNYETGRDLMRLEGYAAYESPEDCICDFSNNSTTPTPSETTPSESEITPPPSESDNEMNLSNSDEDDSVELQLSFHGIVLTWLISTIFVARYRRNEN